MIKECQKSLSAESAGKIVENKHILNFQKSVTEVVATETNRILVAKMFGKKLIFLVDTSEWHTV